MGIDFVGGDSLVRSISAFSYLVLLLVSSPILLCLL
jgi:hypothetical protein